MIHMSRKTAVTSFLVICVMAIAAMPAYATGVAFQASSLPLQVRGEGLTETIGAVVLQATGSGTITGGSSVTIVYSGAIASASSFTGTAGLNCSIGGSTTCFNTTPAQLAVSASGTNFTVAFPSPTSNSYTFGLGDYLEVSQVRMNINALGSATGTVTATLSGTSTSATNPITFTQSQVVVASIVNPSVKATVPASSSGVATPIQTCSVGTGNTFTVKVAENYPAAFTSTTDEAGFTPGVYTVSNGSQFSVAIANVPAGLAISAGSASVTSTGSNTMTVALVSSTNFQISTGAALTYVFSVTGDSTSAIDTFTQTFNIGLPNSAGTGFASSSASMPAIGTIVNITATVSLAPSSGIVSFATNNEGSGTVATVSDCVTNMLFPYVTNQNGYDTSYSIANTTSDALAFGAGNGANKHLQNGSCTLSLWPTVDTTLASASPLGTASQYTTPTIPAGSVYAFSQSATSFSGQTGYVIAVCRFLNAHGFAFQTNGFAQASGPHISNGYLGLVLPNPIGGRTASGGESAVE